MAALTCAELQVKADAMRAAPTTAEARAMDSLRAAGIPFESQVPFGFYIFDVVVPSKLLVIELDGDTHAPGNKHDAERDAFTRSFGLQVLRIPNRLANLAALQATDFVDASEFERRWAKIQAKAEKRRARHDAVRTPEHKEERRARRAEGKEARALATAARRAERKETKALSRAANLEREMFNKTATPAEKRAAKQARKAARETPGYKARVARNADLRKIGQHPNQLRQQQAAAPVVERQRTSKHYPVIGGPAVLIDTTGPNSPF